MKTKYLFVLLLAFLVVVPAVSASDPFTDAVDALNGVYQFIVTLPGTIFTVLMGIAYTVAYPVICLITSFYDILNAVYEPVAAFVNSLISVPNNARTMVYSFVPSLMPAIWYTLFFLSISIEAFLQIATIYMWAKEAIKWW